MEKLKVLYKELQERQKHLKSRKKTKKTKGMIIENLLTIIRVQQLLIPFVVERNEQLVICKKCKSLEMYQYTKTKDKCEDCGNIQDY